MRFKRKVINNYGKEEIEKIQDKIQEKKENIKSNDRTKIENPKISIITPYYNAEEYIEETAKSVLSQTYPFFEWIIVDDGSSEKAKEKLKEISKMDERIKILEVTQSVKKASEEACKKEPVLNARAKSVQKRTGPKCTGLRRREIWE